MPRFPRRLALLAALLLGAAGARCAPADPGPQACLKDLEQRDPQALARYCGSARTPRLWLTPYRKTLEPDRDAERYARGLGLDAAHRARIAAILARARERMDAQAAVEEAARRELAELDRRTAALSARYDAADRARREEDAAARREVRATLTPRQQGRFDDLEAARLEVERENLIKEREESQRPKDPMPPAGGTPERR